jgi:3-keto-5-aminohexanoate cleavage enzyme
MDKAIVTCALTGVLTDPAVYPAPVTPDEMAREARRACEEGASVVHIHFRKQEPGFGHLPSWDPKVAVAIVDAIRAACPGVIINQTTGIVGEDITGPLRCMNVAKPEIAALNAGSLNYLKTRADGTFAWPPILFDNPVDKIRKFVGAMLWQGIVPEYECFDVGIVRAAAAVGRNCRDDQAPKYNFVMGVESGMPADPELLPLLLRYAAPGARWSVTAIGRKEIWPLHRLAAELGGDLRTGLEDTIHLPDGSRAASNGELVAALVATARVAGRAIASPEEARVALGIPREPKELPL